MWLAWGCVLAAAAGELRVAHVEPLGTDVPEVAATDDGRFVAALEAGTGQLRVLDTDTWSVDAVQVCGGSGAAGVARVEGDAPRFATGCADGTLDLVERVDGAWSVLADRPSLGGGAVLGVASEGGVVYAIAEQEGGEGHPQVHAWDPETGGVDEAWGGPSTFGYDGYQDVEVAGGGSLLVVVHGGDDVSKVDLSTGSAVQRQQTVGALQGSDVLVPVDGSVLVAGGTAGVARFQTGSNDLHLVLDDGDGLWDVSALAAWDGATELWALDVGRGEAVRFSFDAGSGNPGDEELGAVAFPSADAPREAASLDGYVVVGTDAGELWVFTDRPWVEASPPSPGTAVDGDEVALTFTSDLAGEWSVLLGATGDDDGEELASGTIDAGGTATATFTVDDRFAEGDNALRVVVTDAEGASGHDVETLTVDNPPGAATLTELGFGNAKLTAYVRCPDDEDLDHLVVYVTTTPFFAEDWPEGGPDFDGDDAIDAPFEAGASPGAEVSVTISPLTNGRTYYVAVRAVDAGGQEGPMSEVVSGTPEETYGAAARAGEQGGTCGVAGGPGAAGAALALAAALAGLARRRRALLAVALAAGLALPGAARAGEVRSGTFEVRYGPYWPEDPNIQAVFGETGHQILWVEGGPSPWRQVALTVGLGFYQELGFLVAADGSRSDEHDMLTALPVTADLHVRLDVLDEQLLVPAASVGGDWWPWRENWYVNPDVGGEDSISGAKYGWHWTGSLALRLDRLEPQRASRLEKSAGIDDSFLVVQYRVQHVGESQQGLRFSGDALSFGLRLDY